MTVAATYAERYGGEVEAYQRMIDANELSGIRSDGTNNEEGSK